MKEKIPKNLSSEEDKKTNKNSVFFTRHSKAGYKTYERSMKSENPEEPFDPENQVTPDLPPEGVELAKREGEKFFQRLNPEIDVLFFVSSPEVRALETANIYREMALKKGFTILKPEHVRGKLAEEIGAGDIRVVDQLAARPVFAAGILNPHVDPERDINWEGIDPERRKRWYEARAVIMADNKGSFGANLFHHGATLKKFFPEIESSLDLHEGQFKNLMKLSRFAVKKSKEFKGTKSVKVLAFGHENYFGHVLNEYFGDQAVNNCETLTIDIGDNEQVYIERRGERRAIE